MNKVQKLIILMGIFTSIASIVFVPYNVTKVQITQNKYRFVTRNVYAEWVEFHFIFKPPISSKITTSEYVGKLYILKKQDYYVQGLTFIMQLLLICGLVFVFASKKKIVS